MGTGLRSGPRRVLAAVSLFAILAAACAGGGEPGGQATREGTPVRVGIVTSTSGPLASYGNQYVEGFKVGISYATRGTNRVKGHPIEVTFTDDAGDPAKATSIATDLIGQGYKILAGTVVSGVALQVAPLAAQNNVLYISGPAATDGITAANRNTFRSGRQTWQDVSTSAQILGSVSAKKVTVFAQDTAFGKANVDAVTAILGTAGGAGVEPILVPQSANDFTPFARRAADAKPDLLFVAWAGATASAMWQALDQQGVFGATTVATGLDQRASYATFGPVASKIDFLSHYVFQAPSNPGNDFLTKNYPGGQPDLFSADGFVAAQMIARAVEQADGDDVAKMIGALEGWSFDAPKGKQTIRAQDHAMLQPMFHVRLVQANGGFEPQLVKTFEPDKVAPPAKAFG